MGLKRAKRLGEVGARGGGTDSTARIHTPVEFRDLLIRIALSKNNNTMDLIELLEISATESADKGGDGSLEMKAAGALRKYDAALSAIMLRAPGYDWNVDPENLTLLAGRAFAAKEMNS